MAQGNLLEIYYDRVSKSEQVVLTTSNCYDYGYYPTTATIEGKEYTVFVKNGYSQSEYEIPVISGGVATTTITHNTYRRYTHIAPACSKFRVSYADIDKEGSGRNSITGEMFRERIGSYRKIELAWDLIPDTNDYNDWYIVLTHLPPFFNCRLLLPSGEIQDKEFYRGDITTNLYLFIADRQIWNGLETTFIQKNLDKFDDTVEPQLSLITFTCQYKNTSSGQIYVEETFTVKKGTTWKQFLIDYALEHGNYGNFQYSESSEYIGYCAISRFANKNEIIEARTYSN